MPVRKSRPDSGTNLLKRLLDQVAAGEIAPDKALRYLTELPKDSLTAAERALVSGEVAEARRLYEKAVQEASIAVNDSSLADALFGLGRALNAVDGKSGAEVLCDAFDGYLSQDRTNEALEAASEPGGFPYNGRILEMLETALGLADPGTSKHTAILSRLALVEGLLKGDTAGADDALAAAIAGAGNHADYETLTLSWKRRGMLNFQNLQFATAMEQAMIAVGYAMRTESPDTICKATADAVRTALVLGHSDTADHYLRIYRNAAETLGYPDDLFTSLYLSAQFAYAQGDFSTARETLARLSARDDLSEIAQLVTRALDAFASAETDSTELARRVLDQMANRELARRARINIDLLLMLRGHAPELGVIGPETARNLAPRSREWLAVRSNPAFQNLAVFSEYTYAYVTRDRDAALEAMKFEDRSGNGIVTAARIWCSSHYRALGDVAAERWNDAAQEFEAAIVDYRAAGFAQPLIWAIVHYGETALRSGRRSQIQRTARLLAEAEPLVVELGMAAARERLAKIRRGIGPRGRQLMGLTDREREVLSLLIIGKRNAEIAERLALSQNTIASHIKSVYTKLGVHNRGEAVATGSRVLNAER